MKRDKRRAVKATVGVESLDDRVVPSPLGTIRAAQDAAIATRASRRAALLEARAARRAVLLEARAARAAALRTTVTFARPSTPIVSTVVVNRPVTGVPAAAAPVEPSPFPAATPVDPTAVKEGPLAKAGQDLIALYADLQDDGQLNSAAAARIRTEGTSAGVDIRVTGDVTAAAARLEALGMRVEQINVPTQTIEGLLPVDQFPAVAALDEVVSLAPIYKPALNFN